MAAAPAPARPVPSPAPPGAAPARHEETGAVSQRVEVFCHVTIVLGRPSVPYYRYVTIIQRERDMSASEAKRRGRPPQYGPTATRGAVRQQWHRHKRQAEEQNMAKLLLELWEVRPDFWKFPEMDERHAETLEYARRIVSRKNPVK
jgi:hypothetical protein